MFECNFGRFCSPQILITIWLELQGKETFHLNGMVREGMEWNQYNRRSNNGGRHLESHLNFRKEENVIVGDSKGDELNWTNIKEKDPNAFSEIKIFYLHLDTTMYMSRFYFPFNSVTFAQNNKHIVVLSCKGFWMDFTPTTKWHFNLILFFC